jgi:hypothetical protein
MFGVDGGSQREQLRGSGQIPEGRGWFAVPEVGRQGRHLRLDINVAAIPVEQGLDRERVPQVVQPRGRGRVRADTHFVDEAPERLRHDGVAEPVARQRHEEAGLLRQRLQFVSHLGVLGERLQHVGMDGNESRLAELRLPDEQHRPLPVDVAAVELDRLTDPQAGRREQPDQRLVSRRPQRRGDRGVGPAHQRLDVVGGVDERLPPPLPVRCQPERRHFGVFVDASQVAGKAAGSGHPPWHAARPVAHLGPLHGRVHRDHAQAAFIEVGHEARQQPADVGQGMAKRMT